LAKDLAKPYNRSGYFASDRRITKTIDVSGGMEMFAIMEYVWKIRDHLKKGSTNYGQLLKLLGDTESTMWDKIRRMQLQVDRCKYAKREMCEMCRVLLEGGTEER
jgi:hypothetical protein